MRFTVAGNRGQAACAVVGCVFLFAALGMLVYGRFCTSIGMAGLYNRASPGIGFILFGVAMACFTPCLYLQRMHRAHIDAAQLGSELKGIVLGFLCYGVAFIFAMGALSSADETGVVGIALAIAFGAVAVCYRRYRKKNPIAYKHTGSAALVVFCGAMAAFSVVSGALSCGDVLDDLSGGWRQDEFAFYGASVNRPSGRGSMLTPTTIEVDLYEDVAAADARRASARLSVNASDWPQVERVLEEPLAEVRWYPETGTLVGARDADGSLVAGDPIE